MPIPTQREICAPLLKTIAELGGSAKPSDLYDKVATYFPNMSSEEQSEELKDGHNVFSNRVQWSRQQLVKAGLIDPSVRGVWSLTSDGKEQANAGRGANPLQRQTFVLTWNPTKSPWSELSGHVAALQRGESQLLRWSTGNSRQLAPGDRVFLLRLGEEPKGIIGCGTVDTYVFEEEHWNPERAALNETSLFVKFRFESLLNPEQNIPLNASQIRDPLIEKMNWSPQASGILIPPDSADALANYWQRHISSIPSRPHGKVSHAPEISLVNLMDAHDHELHQQLKELLFNIDPYQFEDVSAMLLRAMGFREVEVTSKSNDGGIDGHGQLKIGIVNVSAAFQCKRWTKTVSRPEIDAVRGATQGKFDQAIFLTTSSFTDGARKESIRSGCIPVVMIDGDAIVKLMIEHEIGVTKQPISISKIDENFFAEDSEIN